MAGSYVNEVLLLFVSVYVLSPSVLCDVSAEFSNGNGGGLKTPLESSTDLQYEKAAVQS
jgi:hypothetical protein